jgi:2-methylisocitrate lyase-like PEP mutase family enzyme
MKETIVSQLRLLSNGLTPRVEAELMVQAADEIERLEAFVNAGAAMLKESRERNVRLLSQLQEYEVREQ